MVRWIKRGPFLLSSNVFLSRGAKTIVWPGRKLHYSYAFVLTIAPFTKGLDCKTFKWSNYLVTNTPRWKGCRFLGYRNIWTHTEWTYLRVYLLYIILTCLRQKQANIDKNQPQKIQTIFSSCYCVHVGTWKKSKK